MPRQKLSQVLESLEETQGWNRDTQLDLIIEWIEYHCTEEADLIQFLKDKAAEENDD